MKTMTHISNNTLALYAGIFLCSSLALSGCNRGIKPQVNEPTKLVQLSQPVKVASLVSVSSTAEIEPNEGVGRFEPKLVTMQTAAGTAPSILMASADGTVQAKALSGQSLWQTKVAKALTSGVSLDRQNGQTAVVSTKSAQVMGLDVQSGQIRWRADLRGTVLAPALVHNNRVVVLSNDGMAYGLSEQTGKVIWQFATQTPSISVRGSASPTLLDDKTVLIASSDGRLHALDLATGIPAWSRRVGVPSGASEVERMTDVDATPSVSDGQLYAVSYSGQLLGVDLTSKQILFIKDVASRNDLAVGEKAVIATSNDGVVFAFDRQTGDLLWQNDALKYRQLSNPVVINNTVAVGDLAGVVHFLDVQTGNIVSREQARGAIAHLASQTMARQQYLTTQTTSGQVAIWQIPPLS